MAEKTILKGKYNQPSYQPYFSYRKFHEGSQILQQEQTQTVYSIRAGHSSIPVVKTILDTNNIWHQKGSSTVLPPTNDIKSIKQLYTFIDYPKVLRYLRDYSFLIPLLLEIYPKLEAYNIPFKNLLLEVESDPEEINSDQLILLIETPLTPKEAVKRLYKFNEEWWLKIIDKANGKLCINLEF